MLGQEPRQTTSNLGHLHKPSIQVRAGCIRSLERACFLAPFSRNRNCGAGGVLANAASVSCPLPQALIHGLNRHYYSLAINYRKNELEEKMLLNVYKKKWTEGFLTEDFEGHASSNEAVVKEMKDLAQKYEKAVVEEDKLSAEKLVVANVGRQARGSPPPGLNPFRHFVSFFELLLERCEGHGLRALAPPCRLAAAGCQEAPGGERAEAHGVEHRADAG